MADLLLLGSTSEKPFALSLLHAFLLCLVIAGPAILVNAALPSSPLGNASGYVLVFFAAVGLVAVRRAFRWRRQPGPVRRLVPRVLGVGLGYLLAAGGLSALATIYGLMAW